MAFKKKTWTDRVAEFINRRILTKEDGSTELVSVARSEGNISVEGDAFNAENMNDLEQRIADEFASQNVTLTKLNTDLQNEKDIPVTLGSSGINTYAGDIRLKGKRFISNYSFITNTSYSSNTKLILVRFSGVNIKSEKRFIIPCLDSDGYLVCYAVAVVGNGTITFLFSNNIASGTVVHVHVEFDIDY